MKKDTHPELFPVVFRDAATGDEIVCRSTKKSNESKDIDGVEHFVHVMEITAYSHPFYTGEQRLVDAEGRIERFQRRYKKG